MVWYGMVWYGMVWYGMVWYGMVLYGMGMAWRGMVWYGMVCSIRVRDQATASVERLYAAAQECRADVRSFSQSQKRVVAGEAKELPEALASIQARLKDAEDMVAENEKSARENEVCVL